MPPAPRRERQRPRDSGRCDGQGRVRQDVGRDGRGRPIRAQACAAAAAGERICGSGGNWRVGRVGGSGEAGREGLEADVGQGGLEWVRSPGFEGEVVPSG